MTCPTTFLPRRRFRPRRSYGPWLLALLGVVLACGDDDGVAPNAELAFLVGDWTATRFEVRPEGGGEAVDLVGDLDATFTLNVQPSGQYTASLALPGVAPVPEIGVIDVEGSELVFTRTTPPPTTVSRAAYTRPADGRVVFTGPSRFDLDGDGTAEQISVEVEIVREP